MNQIRLSFPDSLLHSIVSGIMDRSSDGSKFIEGRVKIGRKRYRFSAEVCYFLLFKIQIKEKIVEFFQKFLCFSDDSDDEPPIQISGKPASTAKVSCNDDLLLLF